MQSLKVTLCKSVDDAQNQGYNINAKYADAKPIKLVEAVVVGGGTVNGNSTVDLVLETEDGQRYVTMVTSNILKSIPAL